MRSELKRSLVLAINDGIYIESGLQEGVEDAAGKCEVIVIEYAKKIAEDAFREGYWRAADGKDEEVYLKLFMEVNFK